MNMDTSTITGKDNGIGCEKFSKPLSIGTTRYITNKYKIKKNNVIKA